jgi:uncharacterized membrane protein AbrB (regulator of aidB expression)
LDGKIIAGIIPEFERKEDYVMKITRVLLMVLLGVFLIVGIVAAGANTDPTPVPTVPPTPVPEPSTLILLGIGLAAGGAYSFFRRQKGKERE